MFTPFTDGLDSLPREDLVTMAKMLKLVLATLSYEPDMEKHVVNVIAEMVKMADTDASIALVAKIAVDYNELAARLNNDGKGRISRLN